jgi:Protein of unknown function (DUF2568)
MLTVLKSLNLALAFALELAMLASLVTWGFHSDQPWLVKVLLGVLLPAMVAVVWGLWFAPRATTRLEFLPGLLISLVMFLIAAYLLARAGQEKLALVFAGLVVVNRVLGFLWKQW